MSLDTLLVYAGAVLFVAFMLGIVWASYQEDQIEPRGRRVEPCDESGER